MPKFEATGTTGETTKRDRERPSDAPTAVQARQPAKDDAVFFSTVFELGPQPTEDQLRIAREQGIDLPANATPDEISDLISLTTSRDIPASPELLAIARQYKLKVTRYSGKKLLFQRIFDKVSQPGDEDELAAWFAYRVYRGLVRGTPDSPVKGPDDPLIKNVGRQLASNPAVIASIRRYRATDLVWFGRWTAPDGTTHEGGSNKTVAYLTTAMYLQPFALSEKERAAPASTERDRQHRTSTILLAAKGWLSRWRSK
ncbi:hypothetical protein [Massilia horti]|uniref:Uncharacterized protein n=1 Tax=Massilia horti TaxID=2562153 RepID=A0A4Y9T6S3_9BURK|nr:hypothetical protein [Massilia horti]TFW34629.1 hypothetical protein E4O92_03455 [Massilia horti]